MLPTLGFYLCPRMKYGQMHSGTKSDLATILEASVMSPDDRPHVEVLLLDGAVVVKLFKPGACKTFQEYGENVFLKYLTSQMHDVSKRLDIVWDEYIHDSLKINDEKQTRERCAKTRGTKQQDSRKLECLP